MCSLHCTSRPAFVDLGLCSRDRWYDASSHILNSASDRCRRFAEPIAARGSCDQPQGKPTIVVGL
jgi:hypothetical protein